MPRQPDPLMVTLRRMRRAANMTQMDLGLRIGSDGAQVSHWERGETTPSIPKVRLLCEVLDGDLVIVPKGWLPPVE